MKVLKVENLSIKFIKEDISNLESKGHRDTGSENRINEQNTRSISEILKTGLEKNSKVTGSREENKEILKKEVNKLVEEINRRLNPLNKVLKVEIDRDLKIPVFKIIDKETKQVIRQIPLEEILKLWKSLEKLEKLFWKHGKFEKEGEFFQTVNLKGIFLRKEV